MDAASQQYKVDTRQPTFSVGDTQDFSFSHSNASILRKSCLVTIKQLFIHGKLQFFGGGRRPSTNKPIRIYSDSFVTVGLLNLLTYLEETLESGNLLGGR